MTKCEESKAWRGYNQAFHIIVEHNYQANFKLENGKQFVTVCSLDLAKPNELESKPKLNAQVSNVSLYVEMVGCNGKIFW